MSEPKRAHNRLGRPAGRNTRETCRIPSRWTTSGVPLMNGNGCERAPGSARVSHSRVQTPGFEQQSHARYHPCPALGSSRAPAAASSSLFYQQPHRIPITIMPEYDDLGAVEVAREKQHVTQADIGGDHSGGDTGPRQGQSRSPVRMPFRGCSARARQYHLDQHGPARAPSDAAACLSGSGMLDTQSRCCRATRRTRR